MLSAEIPSLSDLEQMLSSGVKLTPEQKKMLDSFQPIEYNGAKMIFEEKSGRLYHESGVYIDLNTTELNLLSKSGNLFGKLIIHNVIEANHPEIQRWYKQ